MQVKAGDVVHVRCKVVSGYTGDGLFPVVRHNSLEFVAIPDAIVGVESRPLQVGDKVTWGAGGLIAEIKVIGNRELCAQITSTIDGKINSQVGDLVSQPIGNFRPVAA